MAQKPHAVVLASPGMGHLTPSLELAKTLVSHHGFEVTFFAVISDPSSVQSQLISSTSTFPNREFLHIGVIHPDMSDVGDPSASLSARIIMAMQKSMSDVRSAISDMKLCPDLLIADIFGTDYWTLADELGMCKFSFLTTSAWFLALTVGLPVLEDEVGRHELETSDCVLVPCCDPLQLSSRVAPFDRDDPIPSWYLDVSRRISVSDGIIVNSWNDLEPRAIESLSNENLLGRGISCRVYPVGPLVKQPSPVQELGPRETRIFSWMDKQPDESILYVSFGSGGSLTFSQTQELALGLELSQQRFIWVVRPPQKDVSQCFFSVDICDSGGFDYLPTGFLDRTKDAGLVIPMWAPQAEILGHKAVGGFLTHCGWNSIVESVVHGVPIIAWPLYAEQGFNASTVIEELDIAVGVEATSGLIRRAEIENAVRKIMADKGRFVIRDRVKKLKAGAAAAREAGKGSSYESLLELAKFCTMKMK